MQKNNDERPIGKGEFSRLMASLGPFEREPRIAVACSGGADSMALAILLWDWARKRGGVAIALIVDHAIRPEAAAEAERTGARLREREIPFHVLRAAGPIPKSGLQSAARRMRYDLLSKWCAANACLHLAVAHHREDQAETVLLRLARGSGAAGLAAMAPVTETDDIRIVRPLLSVQKSRLRATLKRRELSHIDDPSNQNPAFARVRMRALSADLAGQGMTPRRLAATAARMGRARAALEGDVAAVLARAGVLHPQGYCLLSKAIIHAAPEEVGLRALSRTLTCVGGLEYSPRLDSLERLYEALQDDSLGGGRTLAGCRVLMRGSMLLVCREPAAAAAVTPARGAVHWDGRFSLAFGACGEGEVRRLGREGWREVVKKAPALRATSIPAPVRASLPAIWSKRRLSSVPHLGYSCSQAGGGLPREVFFCPRQPLISARFTLQKGGYTLFN